jgi:hypothetical protein
MGYDTSLAFDSVTVIQSLGSGELKTGRNLVESTLAPVSSADPGFVTELYEVDSRAKLLGAFRAVLQAAKRYSRSPVVHIETHGDKEGLALSSGEHVPWLDVAHHLAEINKTSRMNLLVVAALCHGWNMVSILRPTDRAPAFGIIGTDDNVRAIDLYRAMQRFYTRLLVEPHDLREALNEANNRAQFNDWTYHLVSAEIMLCRIFRSYASGEGDAETEEQRVSRLVAELARLRGADVGQTMQWREQITREIRDHARWFNHYRTQFLMLDLFPENDGRFPLRYEDCRPVAA